MSTRRNDLSQMAGKAQPARLGRPAVVDEPPQVPRAGVLVGLDGSPSSWDAFWWACGESRRRGQRLLAVFVSHAAGVGAGVAAVACAFAPLPSVVYEWQSAADELASRLQAEVERHAAEQGVDVTFLHCRGEPARELLRVGEAARADLLVVGKSSKGWHRLAGSISRQLVSQSDAPVVVVVP
jgi:nucleotide-binding universal stress UspA family protein